jgi:hypothetical protein
VSLTVVLRETALRTLARIRGEDKDLFTRTRRAISALAEQPYPEGVCGTFLNRHGSRLEPAMPLPLSARNRRVARAPAHSVIPRSAGWGVKSIAMDAITISTNCAHAPVVTVTPLAAARTLAVARGNNGGIAGLILAQTSNTTIVVRAYRGHHLIGKATIPTVAPPAPPPPSPSPSLTSVPCHRIGHLGGPRTRTAVLPVRPDPSAGRLEPEPGASLGRAGLTGGHRPPVHSVTRRAAWSAAPGIWDLSRHPPRCGSPVIMASSRDLPARTWRGPECPAPSARASLRCVIAALAA